MMFPISVDAMAMLSKWKPFLFPYLTAMAKMVNQPVIIDGHSQCGLKPGKAAVCIAGGGTGSAAACPLRG